MIECTINGICLKMHTESSLFSPNYIDKGTITMVSKIEFQTGQKILDLGCGYGVIGIYAAHFSGAENVTMVDINPIAIELAKKNAIYNDLRSINIFQSDGLNNIIEQDFDLILSNPPYHADFNVPKNFIESGFHHLKYGGSMVMVTKRYKWYKNKLKSVFGGVKVIEENGYYIFISQKRAIRKTKIKNKQKLSKKLQHKYSQSI
ncbi:MAG: methyltransferase [Lachnospiraceae bacterium]|nr:methyltransferase [Lachnospiraceae bacterium]MDE6252131.1 methyltransferase [Lachnospiraceae bacterium]